MSAQHTPGPWTVHPLSNPEVHPCEALGPSFRFADTHIGAGEKMVAEVRMQRGGGGGFPSVECEHEMAANARLITAAPDLLEALSLWLSYDDQDEADFAQAGPMLLYARAIEATRAAVAKARGEA